MKKEISEEREKEREGGRRERERLVKKERKRGREGG